MPDESIETPFSCSRRRPNGVVVLEHEPDRVDQRMTTAALLVLAVFGIALAGGERRAPLGQVRVDVRRRFRKLLTQETLTHDDSALDGRGRIGKRMTREHAAMTEDARRPRIGGDLRSPQVLILAHPKPRSAVRGAD